MNAIGLDIGTTTLCALVLEEETGKLQRCVTLPNDSALAGAPYEHLQDPEVIFRHCQSLLAELTAQYAPVCSIGLAGQMHGILYLNPKGEALSPLYTWQDASANERCAGEESYAALLTRLSGCPVATGFGTATYFTHQKQGDVPKDAACFCTIHDYVAMCLAGQTKPLTHSTDAASFGLYQLEYNTFDEQAIAAAELDRALFPEIRSGFDCVGSFQGIPVSVAIGDNQASFLGSVRDARETLLINVGTGGQISYATPNADENRRPVPLMELRPFVEGLYLRVGASLCGGSAFAALEQFLRKTAEFVSGKPCESAYPAMDAYLAQSGQPRNGLRVSTQFSGTRENPNERGSVLGLCLDNFTPQHLIWGVLQGMVDELAQLYPAGEHHSQLVGSGNGLRKNETLRRLFSRQFGQVMRLPAHREEAAFGAALFGLAAAGRVGSIQEAQRLITYI